MCGIVGFVNNQNDKKKIITEMSKKIIHRGPDGEGIYISDDVALAHRRLAIIDLNTGGQPIYNEKKDKVIVFNGEIYNYLELKKDLAKKYKFTTKTDTEVILHAYEEWGCNCVKKFRGMFAFAIWDTKEKSLFCARDGWGIKPFYYALMNDTFMFASEIKALLAHPLFKKELNKEIISAYMCFNSSPAEETFFKGVYNLMPGHSLLFKDGKITINRFFKLEFKEEKRSMEDIEKSIKKAMEDSVIHHQISDVEVGSFLSSGIDSSYIVALCKPDKTYTVGYDNPKYDEISYAKELAKSLNIENKSKKITKEEYMKNFARIQYYMDEPLADPSAIALYFVAELASKDLKVVLSGEGADEFFGGYNSYKEEIEHSWYNKIPYFIRHAAASVASLFPEVRGLNFIQRRGEKLEDYYIGVGRVFRDKDAKKLVKFNNQISTKDITKPYYEEYKNETNLVKRQVIDINFFLINDFLHAVDRNTMMFGLEARTPFLDTEVYNVARTLPTSAKINKETTKPALRNAAREVIPTNAYKKKKLGFPVPLREWIKEDDLASSIREMFNSKPAHEIFDVKGINKLLDDHINNKKDNYKKVWTIYTFLVWYHEYFI